MFVEIIHFSLSLQWGGCFEVQCKNHIADRKKRHPMFKVLKPGDQVRMHSLCGDFHIKKNDREM